ncbi:acyl-CoA dehydrogenase family protein [Mycobacterium intermedium]|uniref:acyl-CoA dehydrogenase family protein n=1 Tax=Mycobacterium intermedium TaxID=28445 RepID=UPI000849571D|nr:acyl-CoA dehydrogenase family protein [Mycobacterium intermedium]ODR02853.1 hypothetical protein BHQ20_02620 [Mycobacterium intermedium]
MSVAETAETTGTSETPKMFEFTAEQDALREVLREYFAATATLDGRLRWRRLLTEVGADDILLGGDESDSTATELSILAEEAGAALSGAAVVSAAALAPLLDDDDWASVAAPVRRGQHGVSAAISLTGFGEPQHPADGTAQPLWDFDDDALVVLDDHLDGEPVIIAFAGATLGLQRLSGLDPSRSLGRITRRDSPPLLMRAGAAAVDALRAIRRRADLVISAELLGVSQWALDATVEYVGQRVQFGRTVGSFQAIKHRLADLLAQVELARSAVYGAAWQLEYRPSAAQTDVDLAVAAVLAREAALDVTKAAVQLHGGIGITWEHWAHRYLRRAHSVIALTGAPGLHRRRLAALVDARDGIDD